MALSGAYSQESGGFADIFANKGSFATSASQDARFKNIDTNNLDQNNPYVKMNNMDNSIFSSNSGLNKNARSGVSIFSQ